MMPFPDKQYSILLCDPPWSYKVWNKPTKWGGTAESHYPTMTPEEIQQLPVQTISEDNSVLFLWVTPPCLPQGIELIQCWGFIYKTIAFTWVKRNKKQDTWFFGMGHYTRANTELCLLGIRGRGLKRVSASVHQVIDSRIRGHSQKPPEVRDRIVELFGDLPRIELFASSNKKIENGWVNVGCEVNGISIKESLKQISKGIYF